MTPEAIARLRAATARGGSTRQVLASATVPRAPTAQQALQLLQFLALLKRSMSGTTQSVNAHLSNSVNSVIPFDKVAVNKFVKQSVQDKLLEAGVADWAKDAIGGAVLGSLGIGGGSIAGVGAGLEAAASTAAAVAPVAAFGTVAAGLAIAAVDIFGGEVAIPTYATTPQLDATTALGQAAARAQAPLLRASLATSGTKFGFKGERDPSTLL